MRGRAEAMTYRGIPVPVELQDPLGSSDPHYLFFTRGVDAALSVVRPLLLAGSDDDLCEFDHNGYCQTHFSRGEVQDRCANQVIGEFLQASGPDSVHRFFRPGEADLYWCYDHVPWGVVTDVVRIGDVPPERISCVQCGVRLR